MSANTERRAYIRFRLDVPASLCLYQVDIRYTGSVVDLSLGGCFFPVTGDLPVGERCQITLTTGEGLTTEQVEIGGVTVRKDDNGIGIQFLEMVAEQRQVLHRILARGLCEDIGQRSGPRNSNGIHRENI